MNKLAVLAMLLLAVLGSLLWYLAGNSLSPYLAQYANDLKKINPALSVSFGDIEMNHQQGQAVAKNYSISVGEHTPRLTLKDIYFDYDPKSFKKDAVLINTIVISEVTLSISRANPERNVAQLQAALDDLVNQQDASNTTLGLTGKQEPVIKTNKVMIKKLYVTLFDDDFPQQEQAFNNIDITTSDKAQAISYTFSELSLTLINKGFHLFSTSKL